MGLGAFKPGCNCGCDAICIAMRSYRFSCCEQRTYIYVSSPCSIDEIRINGAVVATPGTNEYGALPASDPVVTIDGSPVTGVLTSEQYCGDCPIDSSMESDPPTPITEVAVDCTYNVEVDSCGTTYYCSITFCLPKVLTFYDMIFTGVSQTFECSDSGFSPCEDPLDTDYTFEIEIPPFSFDDIQIDFCAPNENPQTYGPTSSLTITLIETVSNDSLRTLTTTTVFTGTLSVLVPAWGKCDWYFSDEDDFTLDGPFLLFDGDITTTATGPTVPGGSQTSTVSVSNYVLASFEYGVCEAGPPSRPLGLIFTIGCVGYFQVSVDGCDITRCACTGTTAAAIGNYTWCGTGAAPASTLFFLGPDDGGSGAMSLLFGEGS